MVSSFMAYARGLVSIEGLILRELQQPRITTAKISIDELEYTQFLEDSTTYQELSQQRIYFLTEMARTLGYDLVKHDPLRTYRGF